MRREAQFEIYAMTEKDVTPNRPYVSEGNAAVKFFVKSFLGGGDNLIYHGVYGVSISEPGNYFKRAESRGHGAWVYNY